MPAMTAIAFDDIDAINAQASDEYGEWGDEVVVTQEMINQFADLTGDHQWIHVDVERDAVDLYVDPRVRGRGRDQSGGLGSLGRSRPAVTRSVETKDVTTETSGPRELTLRAAGFGSFPRGAVFGRFAFQTAADREVFASLTNDLRRGAYKSADHYQYRALCFGVAPAPRIFTKILRPVIQRLRAAGIRCVPYLDDILILASSREQSIKQSQLAVDLLVRLGFLISPKSCLDPSRTREFLGMTIDSHRLELRVPREKIRKFRQVVRQSLRLDDQHRLTLRQLAGVIGKIQAMAPAVSPARLWSRHLLFAKNRALASSGSPRTAWNNVVRLSADSRIELEKWVNLLEHWNGKSFLPPKTRHVVTTDASSFGWGGWMGKENVQGFWTRAEAKRSSNKRELHTTVLVVQALRRKLQGSVVEIRTDNLTTMAYINHQGGRDPALTELVRPLWDWALQTRTTLCATYIPGKINDRADKLSRRKRDRTDWMLHRNLFSRLSRQCGPFTLDLFATRLNAQVARYVSRFPDPGSVSVDAFRQDLRKERAYANPPFNLITRLLAMVKRQRARLTVVLPAWEAQPWWPLLAEMLVAPPIRLPHGLDTFLPGHLGNELPMGAPRWTAIAATISGAPSATAAFQSRWLELCRRNGVPSPPTQATPLRGAVGSIFVRGVGSIPFADLN